MTTHPLPPSRPGLALSSGGGPLVAAPSLRHGLPQTLGQGGIPWDPLLSVQAKAVGAEPGAVWSRHCPPSLPPPERGLAPVLLSVVHLGFPPNPPHANVQDNKHKPS